ncbi:hypothetical protein F8M41_009500 [Gigaspora margarita]|uniref:Uncharacterized protein n=1 Tax=Gigaspora margarita TaxID=4874 RepID=A0A8H3X236_GIGMA|nr:hypothetical protein F8M41_009500 [Gigaspora margarita]
MTDRIFSDLYMDPNSTDRFRIPDFWDPTSADPDRIRILDQVCGTLVYSKFIQFELIYNKVNEKTYLFENHKDKEINKLIKQSIPDGLSTEISRWRKAFDLAVLIIESND